MNPLVKSLLNSLLAGIVGGTIPVVNGNSWKEILATGVVAVALAMFNLWQHKPGAETEASIARKP